MRPPDPDDPESDDKRMTIQEHLEELRNRLIICVVAVAIGMIPGVFLATPIWGLIFRLLETAGGARIITGQVTQGFMVWLYIALYVGLALATPVVFYQIAAFIAPALTRQEKRFIIMSLPGVFACFLCGVVFAYFIVVPNALNFLVYFGPGHLPGVDAFIELEDFIGFTMSLIFWVGLSFETPVAIVALSKVGILTPERIKLYRKYFIVFAFVAAAFLTPTPDPLNQIIVAVPIIILYEIGALIARLV